MFAVRADDKSKENDYEDLGSTDIVMDYAPRVYISLGGLRNMITQPALSAFGQDIVDTIQIITLGETVFYQGQQPGGSQAFGETQNCGIGLSSCIIPWHCHLGYQECIHSSTYLACDGFSAPNFAKDGIEF